MHSAISGSERPRKLLEITQELDLGGRCIYVSPWLSKFCRGPSNDAYPRETHRGTSAVTTAGVGHLGLPEEAAALRAAVHISRLRGGLTPCRTSRYISYLVVNHSVGAGHRTTKYTTTRRADCSHGNSLVRGLERMRPRRSTAPAGLRACDVGACPTSERVRSRHGEWSSEDGSFKELAAPLYDQ